MTIFIYLAAFIVALGILVTIHELGHYCAARWCDVKVLRFSVGFGRPLWIRRMGPDRTEWVIAAMPLGGYVKMADERDEGVEVADRLRAFNNKSVWQRIFIVIAGPLANFILAAVLYWALFMNGIPDSRPYLAAPVPSSAAARAGFTEFELITRVGTHDVQTWSEARLALLEAASRHGNVDIEVQDATGRRYAHTLDMESLSADDLDRDFLAKLGMSAYRMRVPAILQDVQPQSPAERAGLKPGDRVVTVAGKAVDRWEGLMEVVAGRLGESVKMEVERGSERLAVEVTPDRVTERGRTFGRIGVTPRIDRTLYDRLYITVRYGPLEAIPMAIVKVWSMAGFNLRMMGRMLMGDVSWKNLSGPLTIGEYAGQSAMLGWDYYVAFLALISVSLGVLNLLPVPVLDGGQLLYYIAEIFKGSPVSDRIVQIGQQVGLALLLGLTAFAFYNDIHRLLTG